MKLFKKIISPICALSLIATMTSMVVVHADNTDVAPTLNVKVTSFDETTKEGTLAVSVSDFDKCVPENSTLDNMFIDMMEIHISMPNTSFDQSLYSTAGRPSPWKSNVIFNSKISTSVGTSAFADDELNLIYSNVDFNGETIVNSYNGFDMSELPIAEAKFKLAENATEPVSLSVNTVLLTATAFPKDVTDFGDSSVGTPLKWGNNGKPGVVTMNYNLDKIGKASADNKFVVEPTLTHGDNGANDHAATFIKSFTASDLAGKGHMKLTATIDKAEYPYKKGLVELPNLDGTEVKVGIVIQYSNAADKNYTVNSLAIELVD